MARLALALGRSDVWSRFMRGAQNWQRLFNPATGFVQLRLADGSFGAGFNPSSENGFREGDAWQYRWMVPHNLSTLFRAMGGAGVTADRLDPFFTSLSGSQTSPWHQGSNEVDLGAPWDSTSPDSRGTRRRSCGGSRRRSTRTAPMAFRATTTSPRCRRGTCGRPSACTRRSRASAGWPSVALFPEVHLAVPGGAQTTILAPGARDDAPYVTDLTVYGTAQSAPSFHAGESPGIGFTKPSGAVTVPPGGASPLTLGVQSVTDAPLSVAWSVTVLSGSGLGVTPGSGTLSLDPATEQVVTVQAHASASARSGEIVLRAQATLPGGEPVLLPGVHVRVNVA